MLRIFYFLFFGFSTLSYAGDDLKLESYRQIAEGLLQSYDERARLVAEFELDVGQQYLPGLPLKISRTPSPTERALKVTIIAKQELLPENFKEEISKIFVPVSLNVKLDFLNAQALPLDRADGLKKSDSQTPSEGWPQISEIKMTLWLMLAGTGIFSLVLLFISSFFSSKVSDKAAKTIASSLSGPRSESSAKKAELSTVGLQKNENDHDFSFLNFDSFSLSALIADCYWCKEDEMAAFVFAKVKPQNRRDLNLSFLADYIRFLAGITPEYLGIDKDLSYLDPLAITHLGTEALLNLCKKTGGIYPYLSILRRQSLGISGSNLVSVSRAKKIDPSELGFLRSLPPSPLRELRIFAKTYARSIEDDLALLSDKTVSSVEMAQIVSLVWAESLSKKNLVEMLKPFSARELAEALDAPESTCTVILEALPEQKRNLTLNYLSRSPASRQSFSYTDLYLGLCETLKLENENMANPEEKAA